MNPQVLTLSLLFSSKLTEGHLIANHQKIYPRPKIKIDTTKPRKAILISQRVDFCFQNTRQSKDYIE
jgi:hypothetical protein